MANSFKLFTKFMTINTICKSLKLNKIRTLTPSILLHILVNLITCEAKVQ